MLLLLVEPDADDVANDVADEDVNDVDDDALIDDPETATLAEAANTCSLMRGTGSACGGGETGSSSSFINVEVPAKMANQSITHFLASVCKACRIIEKKKDGRDESAASRCGRVLENEWH